MPIRVTTLSSFHPLALFAGMLPQEDLLQVVPDRRAALVEVAQEQVLLQHRHIVQPPLGKLGIGAAPLHEAAEALKDGFALVEVLLRQTGDRSSCGSIPAKRARG